MTITACIAGTEYTGPTLAEIIDREYGDGAFASRHTDPNTSGWGQVLRSADAYSFHVLDSIYWVEGEDEVVDATQTLRELEDVAREIGSIEAHLPTLIEKRDTLIRRLSRADVPVVDIARAGGRSRAQVYTILKKR